MMKFVDPRDVVCLVGLCLLGTGLWWVKPYISLVTVGAILIILSILPDVVVLKGKKRR